MGVFQTTLTGLLELEDGRREPATLHLFLKGMRHAEVTPPTCSSAGPCLPAQKWHREAPLLLLVA